MALPCTRSMSVIKTDDTIYSCKNTQGVDEIPRFFFSCSKGRCHVPDKGGGWAERFVPLLCCKTWHWMVGASGTLGPVTMAAWTELRNRVERTELCLWHDLPRSSFNELTGCLSLTGVNHKSLGPSLSTSTTGDHFGQRVKRSINNDGKGPSHAVCVCVCVSICVCVCVCVWVSDGSRRHKNSQNSPSLFGQIHPRAHNRPVIANWLI